MAHIWLNGKFFSEDDGHLAVQERGFLLGDGAFETLKVEAGQIRRWERHAHRLTQTLAALDIPGPDFQEVHDGLTLLCNLNGLEEAVARISISRGPLGAGMVSASSATPTVLLTTAPVPAPLAPLRLVSLDGPRRDARNLSSRAKLLGYGDMLHARRQAVQQGADMALLLSAQGHLACADSANLFWMREGCLYTPALETGCLAGTSRAALMDAVSAIGLEVRAGAYEPDCLKEAEGIWVTNAVRGAVPVIAVDGRDCPDPSIDFAPVLELARIAD